MCRRRRRAKGCAWIPKLDPLQLHSVFSCCAALPWRKAAFPRPGCTEEGAVTAFTNPIYFISFHSVLLLLYAPCERTNPAAAWALFPRIFWAVSPPNKSCPWELSSAPACPGCPFWYLLCRWCHLCPLTHPSAVSALKFLFWDLILVATLQCQAIPAGIGQGMVKTLSVFLSHISFQGNGDFWWWILLNPEASDGQVTQTKVEKSLSRESRL